MILLDPTGDESEFINDSSGTHGTVITGDDTHYMYIYIYTS